MEKLEPLRLPWECSLKCGAHWSVPGKNLNASENECSAQPTWKSGMDHPTLPTAKRLHKKNLTVITVAQKSKGKCLKSNCVQQNLERSAGEQQMAK